MMKNVAVIPGDGVGPEVMNATETVLSEMPVKLQFTEYPAGDAALEDLGAALPDETLAGAREADAVLLGAIGDSAADVVIRLRQELDTFVNLRPIKGYPGVDCICPEADMVIVRENTECLYAGIENEIASGVTTATRVITEYASKRIARYAFDYARSEGRDLVTAIHKNNVLPVTGGQFLAAVDEVAGEFSVELEDVLVDAAALHLVRNPRRFEVILTTNLFGDILSDLAAGIVGGLGLSPSANIGEDHGIFEPVHGTAPDIAGTGKANPTAAILSASYMLKFLGEEELAGKLERAVEKTLHEGKTTPDLGGSLTTGEMTEAVLKRLP
ncbi:isocitrate/isopropylmalate dehydrogenase family protein [Candidatus Bipolaricaulota bacterium]|nr:isocitrate/isopropylmalate dehydrogenase family protein [Candidatus Bipolaricaulota bacterium]